MNGQEIRFVTKVGDQLQLVPDHFGHLRRHTIGPAALHALPGQLAQVGRRRLALGHQLVRVFVAKLVQRKIDGPGDAQRLFEQVRRIDTPQHVQRSKMTLPVRIKREPGVVDGRAATDRRQRILQHAPGTAVHVHVAAGYQRQVQATPFLAQLLEPLTLTAVGQQLDGNPQAITECLAQPVILDIQREASIRHPQGKAAGQAVIEGTAIQLIGALPGRPTRARYQPAQCGIAVAILCQQNEFAAARQDELRADDQLAEPVLLRRSVRANDTRHRTLVGDRECVVPEPGGGLDEFLGMGSAA